MNKLVIAFFALAFVALSASSLASNPPRAQTRCNLTEATAPNLRGLRLGMSADQLLALFPGIAKKKDMKDDIDRAKSATGGETVYLWFDPASDGGDPKQFAGVGSVSAGVHKARVVDLDVEYDGATWRSIDEWVAKVSENLVLPGKADWIAGPSENPNKVLRCDGIDIEASIQGGGASIRVTNSAYFRAIAEQVRAAEDKKRQQVKP